MVRYYFEIPFVPSSDDLRPYECIVAQLQWLVQDSKTNSMQKFIEIDVLFSTTYITLFYLQELFVDLRNSPLYALLCWHFDTYSGLQLVSAAHQQEQKSEEYLERTSSIGGYQVSFQSAKLDYALAVNLFGRMIWMPRDCLVRLYHRQIHSHGYLQVILYNPCW